MTAQQRTAGGPAGPVPLIVLIGPPGAGKTTVGGLLAGLLGTAFADTDAAIEAAAGKPVSDIFVQDGEPEFRRLECQAVEAALAASDRGDSAVGVVGLGGGAVMHEQTQARLAGRHVVYLETGFTELAKRVGMDRPRPLLIGTNPRAQLRSLLELRLPVYDKLAWFTVSTDGRDPAEVAAEIAAVVTGSADAAGRAGRPGDGQ